MTNQKNARIWEETVTIPTYPPPAPDPNPMFFENRINQGASGRVYPNPFTDRVNHEDKVDQEYQAVFLENEYIQLMVLPRFGGRIHAALDKTNGYDFIYRQNVIKPALIALIGSWLSGGMEFNWPLHHRPSTFMPVEYLLENGDDGAVTIWMSEHEPMSRMKGMVGVCLYPGKAYFELKVQLYNRTEQPRPFLWWVNTGVNVNENYQLIFPPDVESVTFHSRAYMADYPVAKQVYAGLDWTKGVDISWPKNVNQSTSYFANPSKYNFFGGYDHGKQGGIVHVANRYISPGKKLFTWGTSDFGNAWQATLTDEDGPYVELMASAYSDNQPDFTWIQPYETKSFSQIWYPIQKIGAIKNANEKVAVNIDPDFMGVCVTENIPGARVILTVNGEAIVDEIVDLEPGKPLLRNLEAINQPTQSQGSSLVVSDSLDNEIIRYTTYPSKNEPLPDTAKPPTSPQKIESIEELYLTGLHVEQYLHFSIDPEPYWERALELDPTDSRSNNALGRLSIRRGDFAKAEKHFRQAIQTLTRYNFNPYDGEPHYNLVLVLAYQGLHDEAYDHFYKATWSYAQRAASYFALAQIDVRRRDYTKAVDHLERSLVTNAHNNKAKALQAAVLRRMGQAEPALKVVQDALAFDPLDLWGQSELALLTEDHSELIRILRSDVQNYIDLAFDYASAGLYEEASQILVGSDFSYPMVYYALGYFADQVGETAAALNCYKQGAAQPPDLCFPHRLDEQLILEAVRTANPSDGRAAAYIGNLYYDKKQYEKAIEAWQAATELEPDHAIPWRNLGIALFNKRSDRDGAQHCFEQALKANPNDPRLLMEMDQLLQRQGYAQEERLGILENQAALVDKRDDLSITFAELYSQTGKPEKALDILTTHQFHAWEGGEGGAAGQYALARVVKGMELAESGNLEGAMKYFESAQAPPDNLGVGRGMSMYDALAWFKVAEIRTALGDSDGGEKGYQMIIDTEKRASLWGAPTPLTYYAALSLKALGKGSEAEEKLVALQEFARKKIDMYDESGFYTSRPATTIFVEEPRTESLIQGHYLLGLAKLGLGNIQEAEASFRSVLSLDPHNWWAKLHLSAIT